ncbi:hypothetical protein D3C71_1802060 [compost metagenome]
MNCPMNSKATAAMPSATLALPNRRRALVGEPDERSLGIRGKVNACQINASRASGTTQKNAPRQPIMPPR